MPKISRMNQLDGRPVRSVRTQTYSDRFTLFNAASL